MIRQIIKCDLCFVRMPPSAVWTYEIVPFTFRGEPGQKDYKDDGAWALCDTCHRLTEEQRYDELFDYVQSMDPIINDAAGMRWRSRLIGLFLKAQRRKPPYRGTLWAPIDGQVRHRG